MAWVVGSGALTIYVIGRGFITDAVWTDSASLWSGLFAIVCGAAFWWWAMRGIENDSSRN
jgi:hypothetical protein